MFPPIQVTSTEIHVDLLVVYLCTISLAFGGPKGKKVLFSI